MANEVAVIQQNNIPVNYREKIQVIKDTVAKGASDSQLEMFLTLAERYQLDPFLREIWYTPQVGILTGRDGYLKIAQRDPDFDGIVSAAICEGDDFSLEPIIPTVQHKFGAKRGSVIGAYAVVFHKKRRPVVCYANYAEYKKDSPVWKTYPSAMTCKVAEVLALKRQFGISGLVTEEEVGSHPAPHSLEDAKAAQKAVLDRKLAETKPQAQQQPMAIKDIKIHIRNAKDEFAHEFGEAGEARYHNVLAQFSIAKPSDISTLVQAKQILQALAEAKSDLQVNGVDVIEGELVGDGEPVSPEEQELFPNG